MKIKKKPTRITCNIFFTFIFNEYFCGYIDALIVPVKWKNILMVCIKKII